MIAKNSPLAKRMRLLRLGLSRVEAVSSVTLSVPALALKILGCPCSDINLRRVKSHMIQASGITSKKRTVGSAKLITSELLHLG